MTLIEWNVFLYAILWISKYIENLCDNRYNFFFQVVTDNEMIQYVKDYNLGTEVICEKKVLEFKTVDHFFQ